MEVICKNYKKCQYIDTCDHAKIHNIIHIEGFGSANSCLLSDGFFCYCSPMFLRKNKLKKLGELKNKI
jgi:hypothetical protein